jgi:hypothetical protein
MWQEVVDTPTSFLPSVFDNFGSSRRLVKRQFRRALAGRLCGFGALEHWQTLGDYWLRLIGKAVFFNIRLGRRRG